MDIQRDHHNPIRALSTFNSSSSSCQFVLLRCMRQVHDLRSTIVINTRTGRFMICSSSYLHSGLSRMVKTWVIIKSGCSDHEFIKRSWDYLVLCSLWSSSQQQIWLMKTPRVDSFQEPDVVRCFIHGYRSSSMAFVVSVFSLRCIKIERMWLKLILYAFFTSYGLVVMIYFSNRQ